MTVVGLLVRNLWWRWREWLLREPPDEMSARWQTEHTRDWRDPSPFE